MSCLYMKNTVSNKCLLMKFRSIKCHVKLLEGLKEIIKNLFSLTNFQPKESISDSFIFFRKTSFGLPSWRAMQTIVLFVKSLRKQGLLVTVYSSLALSLPVIEFRNKVGLGGGGCISRFFWVGVTANLCRELQNFYFAVFGKFNITSDQRYVFLYWQKEALFFVKTVPLKISKQKTLVGE